MILAELSDAADRFHEQWSTGEWSGPAQRDWLSWTWPCGRTRCNCCDPERSGRARRALPPWSQVMAAEAAQGEATA